jgi:cold shock CspA family protein
MFIDGNFLFHVSNYYLYHHDRHARISLRGFNEFIKSQLSKLEGNDPRRCHIVESHYFRGRISAREADARQKLLGERLFEDVLMREGVVTHYLPLSPEGEKGIDVWLALETMELATAGKFDVVVLVAGDGDYTCLVRKINALGARVMVAGWDFEFLDDRGETRRTTTSSLLLDQAAYPLMVSSFVDDKTNRSDPLVNGMFVPPERDANGEDAARPHERRAEPQANGNAEPQPAAEPPAEGDAEVKVGTVHNLHPGYGFISTSTPGKNLFFLPTDFTGNFSALQPGDAVEYVEGTNPRGECARQVCLVNDNQATA